VVADDYTPDGDKLDDSGDNIEVRDYKAISKFVFDKKSGIVTHTATNKKYYFIVDDDDEVLLIEVDRAGGSASTPPNEYDYSSVKHRSITTTAGINDDMEMDQMREHGTGWPTEAELKTYYSSYKWARHQSDREQQALRAEYDKVKAGDYTAADGTFTGITYRDPVTGDSQNFATREAFLKYIEERDAAAPKGSTLKTWKRETVDKDVKGGVFVPQKRKEADRAYSRAEYDKVIALLGDSTDPEDKKRVGLAYYKKGDYAKAQEYLEGTVGTPKATAETYRLLADSYMRQGKYEEAREKYEKAALTDPTVARDPAFKKDYANVYVRIAQDKAKQAETDGKYNNQYYRAAEDDFEEAVKLNPDIKDDPEFKRAVSNFYESWAKKHEETAEDPRTKGAKKQRELEEAARNYAKMAALTGDSEAALQSAELYKRAGKSQHALLQYKNAETFETDADKKKEIVKKKEEYKKQLTDAGKPAEVESGADVQLEDVEADIADKKRQMDEINAEIAILRGEIATADPAIADEKRKELNRKRKELQGLQSDKDKLEKKKLDLEEMKKREDALLDMDDDTSRVSRDNELLPDYAKITDAEVATLKAAGYKDSKKLQAAYDALLKQKLEQVEKEGGFEAVVKFYTEKADRDAGVDDADADKYDDDTLKNWNRQAAQYQNAYKKAAAEGDMEKANRQLKAYEELQSKIQERKDLLAQAKEIGLDTKKLRTNDDLRKGITDVKTFESFSENAQATGVGTWDETKKAFVVDGKEYKTKADADKAIHAKISASIQQNKKDLIAGKELSDEEKGRLLAYAKYVLESDQASAQDKKDALALLIATGQNDAAIKAQITAAEESKQISPEEARMLRIYLENNDNEAFRKSLLTHTKDDKTMALGLEEARTFSMSIEDILKDEKKMEKLGYTKVQDFTVEDKQYVELKTSTGTHLVPVEATGGDVASGKYALPTGTFKDDKGKKLKVASKTDYVNALQEGIIAPRDEGYEKIYVSGKNIIKLDDKGKRKTVGYKVKSGLGKDDYSYFNNQKVVNPSYVDQSDLKGNVYFNRKGEVYNKGEIVAAYKAVRIGDDPDASPALAKQYVDVDIGLDIYRYKYGDEYDNFYYVDKETGEMRQLTEAEIEAQLAEKSYERVADEKGEQDVAKMLNSIENYQRAQSAVRTIVVGPTGIGRSFTDKVTDELAQFEWYDEVENWLEQQFFQPEKWERYICEQIVDEDMPEDAVIGYRDDGTEDIAFRLQGEKEYFPDGSFLYQFNWMVRNINEENMEYTVCVNYCDSSCLIVKDAKGIIVNEDSSSSDYVAMYSTKDVGVISICYITGDDPTMWSFSQPIAYEDYVPDEDRNTYGYGSGTGTGSIPAGAQNFS
jgi:tetratricopeptide (TPR) repeat protein